MKNTIPTADLTAPGQDLALFEALVASAYPVPEHAEVTHAWAHGVYLKQMVLQRGWVCHQHVHHYSHITLIARGEVACRVDNEVKYYKSPCMIMVEAGKAHQFMGMQDDTVAYCIHALAEGEDVEALIKERV